MGKGDKLDQGVWARGTGLYVESDSDVSEIESQSEDSHDMAMGLREAVDRGYGSDREDLQDRKMQ